MRAKQMLKNLVEHFIDFWKRSLERAIRHPWQLIGCLVLLAIFLIVLYWAIWADIPPEWTGFGRWSENVGSGIEFQRAKTLWDWMELLLIPVMLTIGVAWLNKREKEKEESAKELEREIAQDKRQQEALDAYLSRMSNLILDMSSSYASTDIATFKSVAEAQTIAVLRTLDGKRKGQVLEFLYGNRLLGSPKTDPLMPTLDLSHAELRHVDLIVGLPRDVDDSIESTDWGDDPDCRLRKYVDKFSEQPRWRIGLVGVKMLQADFYKAALVLTDLTEADFTEAYLVNARLHGAILKQACFGKADLTKASLYKANCIATDFKDAKLCGANFEEAIYDQNTNFEGAIYDQNTKWPDVFDPQFAGARLVDTSER